MHELNVDAAVVEFVAAVDYAAQELVAVQLQIEVGLVLAPVHVFDAVNVVDVAAALLQLVGVGNKRHFAYLADSTVRQTQ